jgi:hypothetical protein
MSRRSKKRKLRMHIIAPEAPRPKPRPMFSDAELSWMQRIIGRSRARRLSAIQQGAGPEPSQDEYK